MLGIGGREREKEWAAFETEALPLMADVFRVANYLARDRRRFDAGNFRRGVEIVPPLRARHFQGKRFAHIILLYRNRRISVLVTEANLPGAGDEEIYSEATAGGMLAARFRTAKHAVFVVSDLTAAENVTIAQKLSPAVRRHIEQAAA